MLTYIRLSSDLLMIFGGLWQWRQGIDKKGLTLPRFLMLLGATINVLLWIEQFR